MKVLMLNGSSHINGTTFTALNEIGKALNNEGIDYEIFQYVELTTGICDIP